MLATTIIGNAKIDIPLIVILFVVDDNNIIASKLEQTENRDAFTIHQLSPTNDCLQVSPPRGDTIPPSLAWRGDSPRGALLYHSVLLGPFQAG
eukprot:scaffold248408_cov103-Cyclotella_meneghiniana.AAC.2